MLELQALFAALTPGALTIIGEQLETYAGELQTGEPETVLVAKTLEALKEVLADKTAE